MEKKLQYLARGNIDKIAADFNIPVLARLPMEEKTSRLVDEGDVESVEMPEIDQAAKKVESLLEK